MIVTTDTDWSIANGYAWRLEYAFDVPANSTHRVGFTTGLDGGLILDRGFSTEGTDTSFILYRDTPYTGGTDINLTNRNDRYWGDASRLPVANIRGGVTAAPQAANRMSSLRLATAGQLERSIGNDATAIILAPSRSYVLDIVNATGTARICSFSAILLRANNNFRKPQQ